MIRKDSSAIQPTTTLLSYFFDRIQINPELTYNGTSCWLWRVVTKNHGYGRFKKGGISGFAHVIACRMFAGPIPEELSCDHLCRRRNCVNPVHIEYVPLRVNILRGTAPPAENAVKTLCKRGHELTGENGYIDGAGKRQCRICSRLRDENHRRKQGMKAKIKGICKRGHSITGYNAKPKGDGKYNCRICGNVANRDRRRLLRRGQPTVYKGTHCKNGHPFNEANTFIRSNKARGCRQCCRDAATKLSEHCHTRGPHSQIQH